MVFGALILRPGLNRIVNIVLSTVYALTIIGGAIGEWNYYILGSAAEIALLAALAYFAWAWPHVAPTEPTTGRGAAASGAHASGGPELHPGTALHH